MCRIRLWYLHVGRMWVNVGSHRRTEHLGRNVLGRCRSRRRFSGIVNLRPKRSPRRIKNPLTQLWIQTGVLQQMAVKIRAHSGKLSHEFDRHRRIHCLCRRDRIQVVHQAGSSREVKFAKRAI